MSIVHSGIYTATQASGDGIASLTITGDIGSGSGRGMAVFFDRRGDRFPAVESVILGPGVEDDTFTVGSDIAHVGVETNFDCNSAYHSTITATGTGNVLQIDCTTTDSGTGEVAALVVVFDGIEVGQTITRTSNTTSTNTATVTESSASGNQIAFGHFMRYSGSGVDGVTESGFTLGASTTGGNIGAAVGYAAGAASVQADAQFTDTGTPITGTISTISFALDFTPTASGISLPIAQHYYAQQG